MQAHVIAHLVAVAEAAKQTHLDDGCAALLHGGDEVSGQPGVVGDCLLDGLAGNSAVGDVRVLRGRVVAPDDHVLHLADRCPGALRHLSARHVSIGHDLFPGRMFDSCMPLLGCATDPQSGEESIKDPGILSRQGGCSKSEGSVCRHKRSCAGGLSNISVG